MTRRKAYLAASLLAAAVSTGAIAADTPGVTATEIKIGNTMPYAGTMVAKGSTVQLFVSTGADKWGDYKQTPWTIGWQPSYRTEAQIYTKYVLQQNPNAKLAILYQNDDFGKDYQKGLLEGLVGESRGAR